MLVALAAAALPLGVSAQRKQRRVALFSATGAPFLRDAMEGKNIVFDARSAGGDLRQLGKVAAELLRARPDVIVVHETAAVLAAAKATQRIPIVMAAASERVRGDNITGLVVDSARYATGIVNLIRDLKPNARRIALLANADDPSARTLLASLNQAASRIRVPVGLARVRTADDYEAAFEQWERLRLQALIVQGTADKRRAVELALKYRIPAISLSGGFVEAGGLMSYSPNERELGHRVAGYVERILKGARPAALAVEAFAEFELALNLKTARTLEVEFPEGLLSRADGLIQ